ncbi:MAG: permease prefix domain 1-containing protein [Acutalibacteraceae bacterium]
MSKPKIVSDYLDAAIPKGLSASRRKLLTEELEGHIYDRVDAYMQMGYTKEESLQKAIEAMGDAEPVQVEFNRLYNGDTVLACLVPFVMVLSVSLFRIIFGNTILSMPNTTELAVSLIFVFSLILAEIWAYRKKRKNVLISFAVTTAVLFIPPFLPYLSMLAEILVNPAQALEIITSSLLACVCAVFRVSKETLYYGILNLISLYLPLLLSVCLTALPASLSVSCDKEKQYSETPKKKKSVRLPYIGIFFIALTAVFCVFYSSACDYYQIEDGGTAVQERLEEKRYKDLYEIYSRISDEADFETADSILRECGLIPQDEFLETLPPLEREEWEVGLNDEGVALSDNDRFYLFPGKYGPSESYRYYNGDEEVSHYSARGIIIPDTGKKPLSYKTMVFSNEEGYNNSLLEKNITAPIYDAFSTLQKGDEKSEVLSAFENLHFTDVIIQRDLSGSAPTETRIYRCYIQYFYNDREDDPQEIKDLNGWCDITATLFFDEDNLTDGIFSGTGKDRKYYYNDIGTVTIP